MTESLPTGTVTFVFTDIERSTRLAQALGDSYGELLDAHRRILVDALTANGGQEVGREGDGSFYAFSRATDAVAGAIAAQSAMRKHTWPEGHEVRVRIGLHTGEARVTGGGYVGVAVHKAHRVCSAGHGGQVLLSATTKELLSSTPMGMAKALDLGEHRLKDLSVPERIFQLIHPDLDEDFPPLRTLDLFPNNLPTQLASFVGREQEIEALLKQLESARLITLTGPGGSGKTRLALQVAAEALDNFPQGAWIVDLAPIFNGEDIPTRIASDVGLHRAGLEVGPVPANAQADESSISATETIVRYFRSSRSLLILDNCEHVASACAEVTETLLSQCPSLTIFATSRQQLGIQGEVRWSVPPLSLPKHEAHESVDEIDRYEAIRLFVERAALNEPSFGLTNENAPIIVGICRRLDGMPLAIELAAAWVYALAPQQILRRLDDQFRILASTVRRPARHETLRATVDWSYDLLSPEERLLLENLTIFSGGFSLEAAERVCSVGKLKAQDVLPLLSQLINKSLVTADTENGVTRYRLLESIRQYGWEKLVAPDQRDDVAEGPLVPVFRQERDYWVIQYLDSTFRLRHSKGLKYLGNLLSNPGREWHSLDLAGRGPDSDAGEILDSEARASYKKRLADLADELEESNTFHDIERVSKTQAEIDAITSQLSAAVGLGGRDRRAASNVERARMSVGKAIRAAIQKIQEQDPKLGQHLKVAVRTGIYCSYAPEEAAMQSRERRTKR